MISARASGDEIVEAEPAADHSVLVDDQVAVDDLVAHVVRLEHRLERLDEIDALEMDIHEPIHIGGDLQRETVAVRQDLQYFPAIDPFARDQRRRGVLTGRVPAAVVGNPGFDRGGGLGPDRHPQR